MAGLRDDGTTDVTPTALPVRTGEGREIRVGTNVLYALFWELGWTPHVGLEKASAQLWDDLVPRLYRVEIWLPALRSERERMDAAFKRGFDRRMSA